MGNIENLSFKDAVTKIKEIAEAADICMFTTALTELPLSSRPMSTQKADDEGNLWFFSEKESDKNQHIQVDSRVQLFYANKSNYEFLSIYGTAEISTDKQKIEELWTPIVKTWFQQGKDDPSITIIKVTPRDAYYWDTKHNKLVSLIKIMASVATGKTMDDGVEGEVERMSFRDIRYKNKPASLVLQNNYSFLVIINDMYGKNGIVIQTSITSDDEAALAQS